MTINSIGHRYDINFQNLNLMTVFDESKNSADSTIIIIERLLGQDIPSFL